MDIPAAIFQAVNAVYDMVFAFATALTAVGVLTMALLQTVKDMLPVRRWFQAWWVRSWLESRAKAAGPGASAQRAEDDLIRLATSGDRHALYDLPIEQATSQMNAAAQIALDYPWEHEELLRCLAAQANDADIRRLLAARPPATGPRPTLPPEETSALIDARNRVTHQVQRGLDGLQISAGFRWKFYFQVASILLSGLFVWTGLMLFVVEPIDIFMQHLPLYALTAIVGGFLAPVARDLVAALQRLRG